MLELTFNFHGAFSILTFFENEFILFTKKSKRKKRKKRKKKEKKRKEKKIQTISSAVEPQSKVATLERS